VIIQLNTHKSQLVTEHEFNYGKLSIFFYIIIITKDANNTISLLLNGVKGAGPPRAPPPLCCFSKGIFFFFFCWLNQGDAAEIAIFKNLVVRQFDLVLSKVKN
jgi:hypothetical protein